MQGECCLNPVLKTLGMRLNENYNKCGNEMAFIFLNSGKEW